MFSALGFKSLNNAFNLWGFVGVPLRDKRYKCAITYGAWAWLSFSAVSQACAQDVAHKHAEPEIVVTGSTPPVVQKDDRTVYNLDANLQATSGSVADVLATLPSVSVDANGGVKLHGDGVLVLVNGRPSPAMRGGNLGAALQSMSGSTIARIEVITSPGPEYRSSAATVINIITKKPSASASKADLSANLGTPHKRRNASFDGSIGAGKWTFGGTLSYREDIRADLIDVDLRTFDIGGTQVARLIEHRSTFFPYRNLTGGLSADYALSDRTKVSVSAEGALRYRPRRYSSTTLISRLAGDPGTTFQTHDIAEQHYNYYTLTGEFSHARLLTDDKLSIKASYQNPITDRVSSDVTAYDGDAPSRLMQSWLQDGKVYTTALDYQANLSSSLELKAGAEIENSRDVIKFSQSTLLSSENIGLAVASLTGIREHYLAAYAELKKEIGHWSIRSGMRFEDVDRNIRQVDAGSSVTNGSTSWSPSAVVSSHLGINDSIAFAYNRRVNRPDVDQLAPVRLVVNTVTNVGNPALKPENIDKYSAKYEHNFNIVDFVAEAYFKTSRDEIVDLLKLSDPTQPYLTSTFQNASKGRNFGVDTSLNMRLSKKVKIDVGADVFHEINSIIIDRYIYDLQRNSFIIKGDLTWNFKSKGKVQIGSQLYSRSLSSNGVSDAYSSINLSASYDILPRSELVANFTNIFGQINNGDTITSNTFVRRTALIVPGQIFFIGLKYKFGLSSGDK
ncbi:hypothetical protein QE385_004027 [Sphingomonas sp. SORGH_AS 950]|uniref:TonB-dependent receptor n=1 Tax=Sphingomonas sp. SORGH_AS_0950 TaxID=3041792 RepID=UPI0027854B8B|nr:outer membrane beta-barrel family protein [Sphingomonas sp. SORGH_AS_0950]MDQ1159630.1 hypothetical protein [Sphingomonas sp. SORGH_AS_0950]